MKFCRSCFDAKSSIDSFLSSLSGEKGKCDYTGLSNQEVYEIKDIIELFVPIFQVFQPSADNDDPTLIEAIKNNFVCFTNNIIGQKILKDLIELLSGKYSQLLVAKVKPIDKILNVAKDWTSFCNSIKHENRFFVSDKFSDLIKNDLLKFDIIKEIKSGSIFYRARVSDDKEPIRKEEMKNPPKEKATPGRANPDGISYLYVCSDEDTILYESRGSYRDYVSVATLKSNKDLKVVVFDNIPKIDPFDVEGDLASIMYDNKLLSLISNSLSYPLRRYDSKTEYAPTQYVCELMKFMKYDGVEYGSAMHHGGINYAFFNGDDFEVTEVHVHEVDDIKLSHKLIS